MRLEDIEQEIKSGNAFKVEGGRGGNSHIVNLNGKKYFHKYRSEYPPFKGLSKIEFALFNYCKYHLPSTVYLNNGATAEERIKKEVSTIKLWNLHGIPSPKIVLHSKNSIVYEFMEGFSFGNSFNGEKLNEEDFGRILDCYSNLRRVAKEKKDIELLHPDPYADNFFYNESKEIVIPIDPGNVVKKKDFEEIDTRINLFFLCKIFHLKTTQENKLHYLKQTADRFTKKEKEIMHALNTNPWFKRNYLELQNKWARIADYAGLKNRNWGVERLRIYYSAEVRESIQKELIRKK
ncbi:MAG: hypothetical protein Q8P15_04055 [Nanoarchaeota archaeon]|nr:hypothetical protein [Nanoarchaeota archaeon]